MAGRRILVASGNRHKVAELRAMLAEVGDLDVVGMTELGDPPEVEETTDRFEGNAVLKARAIAAWARERGEPGSTLVLADDSGLCVDALEGAPGVRSARLAGPAANDDENNEKLVALLEGRGVTRSPAHYVCVLALVHVDGRELDLGRTVVTFEARWDVEVRVERRGTGGFGYDPHAWLPPGDTTVAELDPTQKAELSHRGQALRSLLAWLRAGGAAVDPRRDLG